MVPERLEVFQRRREDEAAAGARLLTKVLLFVMCALALVDWLAR